MSKVKYALFAFICLFVFPIMSHAECDYQRMAELNKIASNVQFSYSYELNENKVPYYIVYVSNLTPDVYVTDVFGNVIMSDQGINYLYGGNIAFEIYSNDSNCPNEKIVSKYIKLPNYNNLYGTDECQNNTNLKHCNPWSRDYKKNNTNIESSSIEDHTDVSKDTFFRGKIGYVLITALVIALLILLLKRRKRNEKI